MKVRPATLTDWDQILKLLESNNVSTPKVPTDMGVGIVVEDDDKNIVGVVGATFGNSTSAYVDYFAIAGKNKRAAFILITHMETLLRFHGVQRYRMVCPEMNTVNDQFDSWGCEFAGNTNYYNKEL
jgi:hypothetical protein